LFDTFLTQPQTWWLQVDAGLGQDGEDLVLTEAAVPAEVRIEVRRPVVGPAGDGPDIDPDTPATSAGLIRRVSAVGVPLGGEGAEFGDRVLSCRQ
jgi:hypothetical protein